jgi:hypothetical protein
MHSLFLDSSLPLFLRRNQVFRVKNLVGWTDAIRGKQADFRKTTTTKVTMKHIIALGVFLLVVVHSIPIALAEEDTDPKGFSKGAFSLTYPGTGWSLEEGPAEEGKKDVNLRITAEGEPLLNIILTLSSSFPETAEGEEEPYSQEIATAFGAPLALGIAEKKEENITNSVGLINFDEFYDLSSRFLIVKPGSGKTLTLDAFSYRTQNAPKSMALGAIIFEGNKDSSKVEHKHLDRILEAYGIVQSIKIKPEKAS